MSEVVLFSPSSSTHLRTKTSCSSSPSPISSHVIISSHHSFPKSKISLPRLQLRRNNGVVTHCTSRNNLPEGGGGGDSGSKSVLDAFLLGKALAEAINERVESTLGELLSTVGRLQAEQQKQVQDFQEEVLERAKSAKEKAAREAMEAQGNIPSKSTESPEVVEVEISPSSSSEQVNNTYNSDPIIGMMINDD
ncbi:hypothetical protein C5167_032115 [Papaver somniferum]|uniref:Uncharacterized protein n=1 Tax=Papaver somniferum TaxID=3469 RepID=A0A4Y7K632_PAPSO|nr:uncharacterized protein At4g13200, chloroplastic-like [Papaver somniferum]RZC68813.1 hypothetical protein C5167_032115 [Papaver somniferum]